MQNRGAMPGGTVEGGLHHKEERRLSEVSRQFPSAFLFGLCRGSGGATGCLMTGHRARSALSSLRWEEWEMPRPRSEGKASEAEGTAPTKAHSTRGLLSEGTALSQATGMDFVPIWPLQ